MMQSQKITITLTPQTSLSDAICKALDPQKEQCRWSKLHQTVNPSFAQEQNSLGRGEFAYIATEWRSQIGVMFG